MLRWLAVFFLLGSFFVVDQTTPLQLLSKEKASQNLLHKIKKPNGKDNSRIRTISFAKAILPTITHFSSFSEPFRNIDRSLESFSDLFLRILVLLL
jgi:hypothetical protein